MSSTDRDRRCAALRRFFDERLMPAARALRARGGQPFALGGDPDRESYYEPRPRRRMTREQFEPSGLESPERLGRALAELWRGRGMPELAELAPDLAALAGSLREVEEETDEVSPFIYVMF